PRPNPPERPAPPDGGPEDRRDEGARGRDDLVPLADSKRLEAEMERGRPRADADALARAAVPGELLLEGRDVVAEDVRARGGSRQERLLELRADRLVLAAKIDERDHVICASSGSST